MQKEIMAFVIAHKALLSYNSKTAFDLLIWSRYSYALINICLICCRQNVVPSFRHAYDVVSVY